jgi:hypothetical protein
MFQVVTFEPTPALPGLHTPIGIFSRNEHGDDFTSHINAEVRRSDWSDHPDISSSAVCF